jgi:hypothetical protein
MMKQGVREDPPALGERRGMRLKNASCMLWPDQIEALNRLSETVDLPMSILIRHAVARFLADHPESHSGE